MQLIIKDVSKTYANGIKALRNVTLTINRGMFGLLGPNGAGKSTLIRTIATLQDPDSGSITLGEIDVLTQKNEVRKILGYLPLEFLKMNHPISIRSIRESLVLPPPTGPKLL